MSSTVRKQAPRLARPAAIYRPGRAPKGANVAIDSDEEEEVQEVEEEGDIHIGGEQDIKQEDDEDEDEETMPMRKTQTAEKKIKSMNVTLKAVNISKEGKVIVAGREESGRTAIEEEESEEESEEDEDETPSKAKAEDEDEDSSEYESESEEEGKPKLQFRPVFVPKRNRITLAEREEMADDTEEAQKRRDAEAEERKKESHDMVAEKEKEEEIPDVGDTDGLDPEGEFEAWRLRELARIKKEKEEEIRREQEREEVERRRALPEAQRLKEDLEHAQKLRDEKPKGQQKFLQKYWHKGAFHQDEEIIKRRDYTEATESTMDVSLLPKVMQVKNFGKRSRTKYTHLVDQDTTVGNGGFGGVGTIKAGGKTIDSGAAGCFVCGGPHLKKDCPQNTGPMIRGTGANGAPTVSSEQGSWKDRGGDSGWNKEDRGKGRDRREYSPRRDRDRDSSRYRPRSRERRRRSPSRSMSRSPPRGQRDDYYRHDERRRSRDWPPERDDHKGKRRRLEAR
uniref:Micro-fibrillar-associated protein 1 C-terminal domain-containing protein n=1 Tax=Moniliophthora roreri TaxID=221103 RepID=A0A0W0F9U1_MONRR